MKLWFIKTSLTLCMAMVFSPRAKGIDDGNLRGIIHGEETGDFVRRMESQKQGMGVTSSANEDVVTGAEAVNEIMKHLKAQDLIAKNSKKSTYKTELRGSLGTNDNRNAPAVVRGQRMLLQDVYLEKIDDSFEDLKTKLSPFTNFEAFGRSIPLLGLSINKIFGDGLGGSLDSIVNFSGFIESAEGIVELDEDNLEDELNDFFANRVGDVGGNVVTGSAADGLSFCGDRPILVEFIRNPVTSIISGIDIKICSKVSFTKTVSLDTADLLSSIADRNVVLKSSADVTVMLELTFGARVRVKIGVEPSDINLDPLKATVSVGASNVGIDLIVGVLGLSSSANVDIDLGVTITECTSACSDRGDKIAEDLNFYVKADNSTYRVTGGLTLSAAYPGIIITGASFDLQASSILGTPDIDLEVFNVESFFERFSPVDALNALLRSFDSAFVRAQENNEFLKTSIPLTESSFAENVLTGSFLTSQRSALFAGPVRFDLRAQKSVNLTASLTVDESNKTISENVTMIPLELYVVRDELKTNPENRAQVRALAETTVCSFTMPNSKPLNEDAFATDLVGKINGAGCNIRACRFSANCQQDQISGDISKCSDGSECDIVIDANSASDNKLFIASNAFFSTGEENDVVLIGLYQQPEEPDDVLPATSLFGLPLNEPAVTKLVPRFSTFAELVDRIETALNNRFSGVSVDFEFIPENGEEYARFEIGIGFQDTHTTEVGWNVANGIGDFKSIELQGGSSLSVVTAASFSGRVATILGANRDDEIFFFAQACNGTGFVCDLDALTIQIDYKDNGSTQNTTLDLDTRLNFDASDALREALESSGLGTVEKVKNSTLKIVLDRNISSFTIRVPKKCEDQITGKVKDGVYKCSDKERIEEFPNDYGLRDGTFKKRSFQIAIGDLAINGTLDVSGSAELSAALNDGLVEVSAELSASLSGSLNARIGFGDGGFIRFREWIENVTSLPDGFFAAICSFDGSFNATISPTAPFNFVGAASATGGFSGFTVDFLGSSVEYPDITFDINLQEIGNVTRLPYGDVVGCLSIGSALLVGGGSTDSCTGGILAVEIGGKSVFSGEIPGLGVQPCSIVGGALGVVPSALDALVRDFGQGEKLTLNGLTKKLEAQLEDNVGGTPEIRVNTESSDERSKLSIELILSWNITETFMIGINLGELFGDIAPVGDILADLIGDITPEAGGEISLDSSLRFRFGVGIEIEGNVSSCFVLGTSGLDVGFTASGSANFSGGLGPFRGLFESDFEFFSNGSYGLSLSVGFNPAVDFQIDLTDAGRSLDDLLGSTVAAWLGGVKNLVRGSIPILGIDLEFDLQFPDLNDFLKFGPLIPGTNGEIDFEIPSFGSLAYTIKSFGGSLIDALTNLPKLADLILSGAQLDLFINAVDSLLGFIDDAAFGIRGALTNFEVPYIKNAIFLALGGGPGGRSILSDVRSKVVSALQDALPTLVDLGLDFIIDGTVDLLDKTLRGLGVLQTGGEVTAECFDKNISKLEKCNSSTHSILWNIPFGQNISVGIPIDFDLDAGNNIVQLEISIPEPELKLNWWLNLSIGYNRDIGIFLDTRPGERSELGIIAQLEVLNSTFRSRLLFLEAEVSDLDMVFAAGIFVDANQESATRESSERRRLRQLKETSVREGWMKLSLVASKFSSLFDISAIAASQITAGDLSSFSGDELPDDREYGVTFRVAAGLGKAGKFIPELNTNVAAQARKEVGSGVSNEVNLGSGASERRLSTRMKDKEILGGYSDQASKRVIDMVRSLQGSIVEENFDDCPLANNSLFCFRLLNVALNATAIADLINPIIEDVREFTDPVGKPLLTLDDPIPGLSDVVGSEISVLDVAEALVGPESGVKTVRKFLKIYEAILNFAENLSDGYIDIAEFCEPRNGTLQCFGDLFDKNEGNQTERSLAVASLFPEAFGLVDKAGNPMTPNSALGLSAQSDCTQEFSAKTDCAGGCKCGSTSANAKCKAAKLKCRAKNVEGLSFPVLENPSSLINLLVGGDVRLVEFTPPTVEFAFGESLEFILYPFPTVILEVGFEFSAVVEVTFVLDTKGIREAIEQEKPIKALNSFGFLDIIDGVDEPFIVLTGTIYLDVSVSAAIVKIGVTGGVTFVATIDFFDPYPDTSGGVVRPYELLVLGTTPFEWFEFSLEIFVRFSIYIKIGFYAGFIEVTLFKKSWSYRIDLIEPLFFQPSLPCSLTEVNKDRTLVLDDAASCESLDRFECTGLSGVVGNEVIECLSGDLFKRREGVGQVRFDNGVSNVLLWRDIQSPADFTQLNLADLILDYTESERIIPNKLIVITGTSAQIGSASVKFEEVNQGKMMLPQPEISLLTTSFESSCDNPWSLTGHSNVLVRANEVVSGCNIKAEGGEFNAGSLTIDFGSSVCFYNNSVDIGIMGDNTFIAVRRGDGAEFTVEASKKYTTVLVRTSNCKDTIFVSKTLSTLSFIQIYSGPGSDTITIGSPDTGLDMIFADLLVDAGSGSDTLKIDDSGSSQNKVGRLTSSFVFGLLPKEGQDFGYSGFEEVDLRLTTGFSIFNVTSTARGSTTNVTAGPKDDVLTVITTQGDLNLFAGDGSDTIVMFGLGEDTQGVVYGGDGNDVLTVDGRTRAAGNRFDQSLLRWSGGPGDDDLNVFFTSFGTSNLDVFDDNLGENTLSIDCAEFNCTVLSRENFIANIHDMEEDETSVERINIDRYQDPPDSEIFVATASFLKVLLRLNGGMNNVYFDDTFADMEVFGGPLRDEFRVGQLYNSERDALSNVAVSDPIQTTLTTRGYLSNGNSYPVSLNGGFGDDFFDVLRNLDIVDLNGQSGDDVFVIRSFVAVIREDGSLGEAGVKQITAKGDDGDDEFVAGDVDTVAQSVAYVVNSLIDIDGGTGVNRATVVGTEADDSYVMTESEVFGSGLSIKYANIQRIEVTALEGNDLISVLSTGPQVSTSISGNLGADTFRITPRTVDPVISKNLRGHRGIVDHTVTSDDDSYAKLLVEGVAVNVLDNDGLGYINVIEDEVLHLFTEGSDDKFSFYIYPTIPPSDTVSINIVAQGDIDGNPYLRLNDNAKALEVKFDAGDMEPREITVDYNGDANSLEITDVNLIIRISLLEDRTFDDRFKNANQSILPIDVRLLPGLNSEKAKSVAVVQPEGKTKVLEGGFEATYDVYLRPCTDEMKEITVNIEPTVMGQINLDKSLISSGDWDSECKATVTVTAEDDKLEEGDHFVSLLHTLNGDVLELSDNSTLSASNVLVRIYDNDIGGLIVDEPLSVTRTAEIDDEDKGNLPSKFYEDSYRIRLTRAPKEGTKVRIIAASKEVYTDTAKQLAALGLSTYDTRRLENRPQVAFENGNTMIELVFDSDDWDQWYPVTVAAINDDVTEGVDVLHFASQPSYLSFIQGPLALSGFGSDVVPEISDPLLLPGENDTDSFVPPEDVIIDFSSLSANETNQVDRLLIYNLDVRGSVQSVGTLKFDQLFGFNMGESIVISQTEQRDGIVYGDMEVVEIYLGNGVDNVTVENTSEALHLLDLADGDDATIVKDISGPFLVRGKAGADTLTVSSNQKKLDQINALLMFDGGDQDAVIDSLALDDSGDENTDDILNVTRLLVEVKSMDVLEQSRAPIDSYLVSLREASGGSFDLTLDDPVASTTTTITVLYPVDPRNLEQQIKNALLDGPKSCGKNGETICSDVVQVHELGEHLAFFFVGERLNYGVRMSLNTNSLLGFDSERFLNNTNDILFKNADMAYANVETLLISTGSFGRVINVRGTSANKTEIIATQSQDDFVFIGSDANVNSESAPLVDFLHGWVDYLEGDLTVHAGVGRNRLMISDESSSIAKGAIGIPMTLQRDSLTQIKDILGDIYFTADAGDWSRGVNIWLSSGDDIMSVLSIPNNTVAGVRTTTSIHAGEGNDKLEITLDNDTHGGSLFVANGQGGDDVVDASTSSLPVILFGDGGDDTLEGGSGNDIVFGDFGRVYWRNHESEGPLIVAISGGGGYGDLTDGKIRNASDILSTGYDDGGNDTIILGQGDDVGIGGFMDDRLFGDDDRDIIFGDSAEITYWPSLDYPRLLLSVACDLGGEDELHGGAGDVDYLVGSAYSDTLWGNGGVDVTFGDHAHIELSGVEAFQLLYAVTINASCEGGDDFIDLGEGDDLAFGGAYFDVIYGQAGQDIIFGDFGYYNSSFPYPQYRSLTDFFNFAGDDTIFGGDGDDILFGQEGADTIYGEAGNDDIVGGHNVLYGRDTGDTLDGGDDDDVILGDNGMITRRIKKISSAYPFDQLIEWETFPDPFPEVIRDVQRYDDVDLVEGDDIISGGNENDILHGQRGNDVISGGPGDDELYGELGDDTLNGDQGNDILIGDIGYAIRRFASDGETPLETSIGAWLKDIILEEQGFIKSAHRISTKLDVGELTAEDVSSSAMMIVASGLNGDGSKKEDASLGGWVTEMLLFDLQPSNNDIIDGGDGDDTIIGQRGDDTLRGSGGNDFIIGDSGFNNIAFNMDFPRIYEVYRALPSDIDAGYIVPKFGVLFAIDFSLYPFPYRYLDSLGSIIDLVVSVDDVQKKSNLLNDILGISALSKYGVDYCMQPIFRITPGFLNPKQILHGNDVIEPGSGDNLVIGDSIRGTTGLDLSGLAEIENVRTRMDDIIEDLAKRISTIETDVQLSSQKNTSAFELCIACDTITTDPGGMTLLSGDSLTLLGRTLLGDVLMETAPEAVLNRLHDVELVLVDLHFAFYELHTDLLRRQIGTSSATVDDQAFAKRKLHLGDDVIKTKGDGDIAIGDSATLFMQTDRSGAVGFEFTGLAKNSYRAVLKDISTNRESLRDQHAESLDSSPALSQREQRQLPFGDVPFLLSAATDNFELLGTEPSVVVGDFALIGAVSSVSTPSKFDGTDAHTTSIETLRKRPVQGSVVPSENVVENIDLDFYKKRYTTKIGKVVEPTFHGDVFGGSSTARNVVLGDLLTAMGSMKYGNAGSFVFDDKANAFSQYTNGQIALEFAGDEFNLDSSMNLVNGQKGKDVYLKGKKKNLKLEDELSKFSLQLFTEHELVAQMRTDLFEGILLQTPQAFKSGFECSGVVSNITVSFVDEPSTAGLAPDGSGPTPVDDGFDKEEENGGQGNGQGKENGGQGNGQGKEKGGQGNGQGKEKGGQGKEKGGQGKEK